MNIEFLWWWYVVVCKVIFMSNLTYIMFGLVELWLSWGYDNLTKLLFSFLGPSKPLSWAQNWSTIIRDKSKKAGHNMAIVGEPRNVDAPANIPDLFMTMLCTRLCVHMYCKYWLWLFSCLVDWSEHRTRNRQSQMLSSGSPTKNKLLKWSS